MANELRATGAWVLERFQLRKELHVGSCGELWLARERDTRELYVARIGFGEALDRVRNEGEVLSRLQHMGMQHMGIPRLVDQGPVTSETLDELRHHLSLTPMSRDSHPDGPPAPVESDQPDLAGTEPVHGWCTICEYVEGATLGKVLRVASPAPPRAAGWARQLALALAQVHEIGIVHGDLHPDHVIVGRDEAGRDRLVVVGFGEASPVGAPRRGHSPSPSVAAPEVLQGAPVSPAVDLYALGAILYRMLADRWPFSGPEASVLDAHLSAPPPPLGRHLPSLRLPPGLETLVYRCLAKDPLQRVGSARELAQELETLAFAPQRDWVPVHGATRRTPTPSSLSRRRQPEPDPAGRLLAAVLILVLLLVLAASWSLAR